MATEELGDARIIRVTDDAVLCDIDGIGETWIPKSVLEHPEPHLMEEDEEISDLEVQAWWAQKEGLV